MSRAPRVPEARGVPRAIPAVLAAAAFFAFAAPRAHGQGLVRISVGAGRVGLAFDGATFRTGGAGASSRQTREWLELPFTGSLVDTRLVQYSLNLRPVFEQRAQPDFTEALGARQLDASVGARFLPGRALNAGLDLQRGSGVSDGGLGSRRAFTASRSSASLWWQNRVFPAHVTFTRSSDDERWVTAPGAVPLRALRDQRTLRLAASSSKTSFDVQRVAAEDGVTGGRLVAWEGNLLHTLQWGHGSRLESSWQRAGERGSVRSTRAVWAERAHLRHTPRLTGDYAVQTSEISFGEGRSRSGSVDAAFSAPLGRHASAGLGLSRQVGRVGETRQSAVGVSPRLSLRAGLPVGFLLAAGAAVSIERRSARGPSSTAVPVADEAYVVPPTRGVVLPRTGVETASLIVRSADGVITYVEGVDYRIVVTGGTLQVAVMPGSRIQVGETVLVSYRYRATIADGTGSRRVEVDVALSRRGLQLRHRRSLRTAEGVGSGAAAADALVIPGFDESRTEARLQVRTRLGTVNLDAEHRRWSRREEGSTEFAMGGALAPPPLGRLTTAFAVNASASRSGPVRVRAFSSTATLSWPVSPAVQARASVESFQWGQTALPGQRYLSAVVGTEVRAGRLEGGLRLELHHRDYLVSNVETRVAAQLVRRF